MPHYRVKATNVRIGCYFENRPHAAKTRRLIIVHVKPTCPVAAPAAIDVARRRCYWTWQGHVANLAYCYNAH